MHYHFMSIAQINKVVLIVPEKAESGVPLPNLSVARLNATLMVLLLDGFGVQKSFLPQKILPQVFSFECKIFLILIYIYIFRNFETILLLKQFD